MSDDDINVEYYNDKPEHDHHSGGDNHHHHGRLGVLYHDNHPEREHDHTHGSANVTAFFGPACYTPCSERDSHL